MPILAILLIAFAAILIVSCTAAKTRSDTGPSGTTNRPPATSAAAVKSMTRKELQSSLKKLSDAPAPPRAMGAMCYETVGPPATAKYVCPICGEHTLYTNDTWEVDYGIQACRREFDLLQGIAQHAVSLDEADFCRKCRPSVASPKLALVTVIDGNRTNRVTGITNDDIRILHEFLTGKTTHMTSTGGEIPLKEFIPRIELLLGIKPLGNDSK